MLYVSRGWWHPQDRYADPHNKSAGLILPRRRMSPGLGAGSDIMRC